MLGGVYTHIEGEASAVLAAPGRGKARGCGAIDVEFQGWLGDDLLDLADRWIVSGRLADALRASDLSGYQLGEVRVSKRLDWDQMQHEFPLPERWEQLVPTGQRRDGDDFATEPGSGLMVSDRALTLLRGFRLEEAYLAEVTSPVYATDEEAAAAETERLVRVRALAAENQKRATLEREEQQRASDAAHADRDAKLAAALERHRQAHPDPVEITGDIDVIRAAIGKPLEDERVAAALALATQPLEVEVTYETKRERHVSHTSIGEGFDARFKNDKLDLVVLYPRGNEGQVNPLGRTFVVGLDFAFAAPWDVVEALGEPAYSKFGARGTLQYEVGAHTLTLGTLRDRVESVSVRKARKRRR